VTGKEVRDFLLGEGNLSKTYIRANPARLNAPRLITEQRMTGIRILALVLVVLAAWSQAARSAEPDYSTILAETLIDELTLIDAPVLGVDGKTVWDTFIADNSRPHFRFGVLGPPPPVPSAQMRELARRGVKALPALLADIRASENRYRVRGAFARLRYYYPQATRPSQAPTGKSAMPSKRLNPELAAPDLRPRAHGVSLQSHFS
jgi:hypothetical protein